jgi:hypothetical protein
VRLLPGPGSVDWGLRLEEGIPPEFGPICEEEEIKMPRLVRLDRSGHTELAEWTAEDQRSYEEAARAFREGLEGGYMGVAKLADDSYEQVKELPTDVELVVLRRPIAGG